MKFDIIVCCNSKWVIGNNEDLLYHIKSDLLNFARMTRGGVVIMGRKTFDSLPNGALKDRINIVITSNKDCKFADAITVHSIEEAVALCEKEYRHLDCFVIGGSSIYKQFIDRNLIKRIYMTLVYDETDGDATFPTLDIVDEWKLFFKTLPCAEGDYTYEFRIYQPKPIG